MISYHDLSEFDFQLLDTIYQNQPVSIEKLEDLLPNQRNIRLRLELLAEPDWASGFRGMKFAISNTSYIDFDDANTVRTTALGKKAIEEWTLQEKIASKQLWENRLWKFVPICISLLALIVATISLLEALHWIHLEQ